MYNVANKKIYQGHMLFSTSKYVYIFFTQLIFNNINLFKDTYPDSLTPEELRLVDERYVDVSEITDPELTAASKGLEYVLTKGNVACVLRFVKSETI